MWHILGVIAVTAIIIFTLWIILKIRGVILLTVGIIGIFICGLSFTECPKCDGKGEFSKETEHQEQCKGCDMIKY